MEVMLLSGQSLWDIALQEKGLWQAGIDIAFASSCSLSSPLEEGTRLQIPIKSYDRQRQRMAKTLSLHPATADNTSGELPRIFSHAFNLVFT